MFRRFYRWLIGDKWEVAVSGWPYKDGYATYNPYRRAMLDSGLPTKEYAQKLCDELNASKARREAT